MSLSVNRLAFLWLSAGQRMKMTFLFLQGDGLLYDLHDRPLGSKVNVGACRKKTETEILRQILQYSNWTEALDYLAIFREA